jgi:SNF2 family DNA or RNA helicase
LKNIPPPFQHQKETSLFIHRSDCTYVASDPGTGKTRAVLDAYASDTERKRMLVVCPKSIMLPAWVADCRKFTPDLSIEIAKAPNKTRRTAFEKGSDIVVVNHDAAKWLNANIDIIDGFNWLVIDEATAFKNPTSQRSRALMEVARYFTKRIAMSGTPTPNSVMELWSQMKILDEGSRLGRNYYQTRSRLQMPIQEGQFTRWEDREDAREKVFDAVSDVTIRHTLEEVLDMPEHINRNLEVDVSQKLFLLYTDLAEESRLLLETGTVDAVNKAVLQNKLLQLCSGAIYNSEGGYSLAHPERYELILDLVKERSTPSLVAYLWRHQVENLISLAEKQDIRYAALTDKDSLERRNQIVEQFQAGLYQVLFAHPASAGHGLTLTKGRTVIWASPTWNSEHYIQFNRRIYRAGQNFRTEVINIAAAGTVEPLVYDRLNGKIEKGTELLDLFNSISLARAA